MDLKSRVIGSFTGDWRRPPGWVPADLRQVITLGKKGDQQALRGDRRALQGPQRRLRYGDSTPVAVIELVDRDVDAKGKEDRARHEAAQPASEAAA